MAKSRKRRGAKVEKKVAVRILKRAKAAKVRSRSAASAARRASHGSKSVEASINLEDYDRHEAARNVMRVGCP